MAEPNAASIGGKLASLVADPELAHRLGQAGKERGERITWEEVVEALLGDVRERILAGGDRALFASSRHASRAGGSYRSQWWVSHNAQGAISALGVYGQRVHIEPAAELALVRFGSYPLPSNLHTDAVHQAAFDTLRAHLTHREKSTATRSPPMA